MMMKETLQGIIRHTLTAAGGSLIAKGVLTANTLDESVGAVVTLVGVIWSILAKKQPDKQ